MTTLQSILAKLKSTASQVSSVSLKRLAIGLLAASLPAVAHAGDYKVYGSQYALNNDYNASGQIGCSFGSGDTPNLTAWFNFSSEALWAYPAAIRGYHYGQNPAGDTLFPFQLKSKSSIPCSFAYSAGGSNMKGDFAWDMFLRWDNSTYWQDIPQLEVMVWAGHNSCPIGEPIVDNALYHANTYWQLWKGYNEYAGYWVYTFIPQGSWKWEGCDLPTSGSMSVDMKVFFDYLAKNRASDNLYNDNMYLDVIEAGFEVVKGDGWVWVQGDVNATSGSSGVSNGTYKIIARHSGKALDAKGQGTSNYTQIQQWSYYGLSTQKWTVTNRGNWYSITQVASGKSLDIYKGYSANETKVQLYSYHGGSQQQFTFGSQGSGYYRITPNCATSSCLDVSGGTTATGNGAIVWLYQWVGATNQQWSLQTP